MALLDSIVEWFNGLIGLQYAGYGPITAIFIGILTVAVSLRIVKFFFQPFIPLFQTANELGEFNPVLEQKGIRHSQLVSNDDDIGTPSLFDRSKNRFEDARTKIQSRSRRDELLEMDLAEMDLDEVWEEELHIKDGTGWEEAIAADLEDIKPIENFSAALEDALKKDTGADPTTPINSKRRPPSLSLVKTRPPLPRATASSATPNPNHDDMPLVQVMSFGDVNQKSEAANRLALRLSEGVKETLARIPNLGVEASEASTFVPSVQTIPGFGSRFVVEGGVRVEKKNVHASISVRDGADGSELLSRDMKCRPSQLQSFEKEVALEIAAAVIAHQRSQGRSVTRHLRDPLASQANSKYPTDRRRAPVHLHKTDQPMQ
jgi:TolB-like protein